MWSYSNEKDIQWMRRTVADLKAKIEESRSAALTTFPQPDFSVSAPKSGLPDKGRSLARNGAVGSHSEILDESSETRKLSPNGVRGTRSARGVA